MTYNPLSGPTIAVRVVTGTTDTLLLSDNGGIVEFSNGSAVALTVPNTLPQGFNCLLQQVGAGTVTVAADAGATQHAPNGATIAGQYKIASLVVNSNAGTAADYTLSGDTA